MRVRLLHCLAGAIVKHGLRFLMNLAPGGEAIFDIAADTWKEYRRGGEPDTATAELESLAQAPAPQLKQAIDQTVGEVAASQPAEVQQALAAYLAQVPAAIRRSLRRPSDPGGTTVPATQKVRDAQDLVPFLPAHLPRFKAGDHPLPGVDWELEELAGIGGFGEVWKARHPYLKSKPPVALKFCLDPAASAALRNEAGVLDRVMQQGRHAGIVPLLHTYLSADPPCLEYEYVEGGDLTGLIQEMHATGRVKPAVANRLLQRLAEIVAFAHQAEPPIVHGDLKPANVLVRRTPDGKMALRVIDFGIGGIAASRAAQEVRQTTRSRPQLLTEAVRGAHTPLYASPEQMARRPGVPADPRDDVHALGVIWFQLVTGDLALTSIPTDWRDQLTERGLSEELVRLIGACFAPKAEKRPASAVALVEQIKDAEVPMLELADESDLRPAGVEKPRAAPGTARPKVPIAELVEESDRRPAGVEKPRAAPGTARPEQSRGTAPAGKPATARPKMSQATAPQGETDRRDPAPETQRADQPAPEATRFPWKWLVPIVAVPAVLMIIGGVIAFLGVRSRKDERQNVSGFVDGSRGKTDAPRVAPPPSELVTLENFGKLRADMSLQALEAILGTGRRATDEDARWIESSLRLDFATRNTWKKAIKEARVKVWESRDSDTRLRILAAFSDNLTSGSKVEVILGSNYTRPGGWGEPLRKPADRWVGVSKDSFLKLKVGMTLKELEDVLGKSERVGYLSTTTFAGGDRSPKYKAWNKAVKEYRVCDWRKDAYSDKNRIWAAFPEPPSATTKVEALLYRDGVWDEDRGSLSSERFLQEMQGLWAPVQLAENGKDASPALIKNLRLRISDDKMSWLGGGYDDRLWVTFSIDPSKTPKHLEWSGPASGKQLGIYDLRDKQLKICVGSAGGARPTTFTSTAENRQYLFVLERPSGAPAKPAQWKEFTPNSKAFTVKMPGEVEESVKDLPPPDIKETTYVSVQPTSIYMVTVVDLSDERVKKGANTLFARGKSFLISTRWKILSENSIKSGNYAGREWLVDAPNVGRRKVRLFLVGKRSIWLEAGPATPANEANHKTFFDSFQPGS
jgi:uncharacterized protein (TIGR03067 family)